MGSGNDFLRMFGPDACRFYDLRALLDAPQASVDLIECNGRLALNVCSVGFDARIGLGAADFKKLPLVSGPLAYQLSAVRTIVQGIHRPYRVTIDGERLPGEAFTLICACNGRYYGRAGLLTRLPNDGLLDFVVVPAVSRLTILTPRSTVRPRAPGISRGSFCAAAGRCTSPVSGPTGSIWTVKSWWILSSLSVCLLKK